MPDAGWRYDAYPESSHSFSVDAASEEEYVLTVDAKGKGGSSQIQVVPHL